MPAITPFLWFDHHADEAMAFYTSLFPDSGIDHVERYPDESLDPHFTGMAGKVITGAFHLCGQPFRCLDGGPLFPINPAISFYCAFGDRATVERIWHSLADGGTVMMDLQAYPWSPAYGWVQDRFGVSWQLALDGETSLPQRITPALMFTGPAAGRTEQAMALYGGLFTGSGVDLLARYAEGDGDTPGLVKHAQFHLGENRLMAMDSTGPHDFVFTEGVSLVVDCRDQAEIDLLWNTLTAEGGSEGQCGWCKDPFGVSWQIVPSRMGELLGAGPAAIQAMMAMRKIDIAELERAGQGA